MVEVDIEAAARSAEAITLITRSDSHLQTTTGDALQTTWSTKILIACVAHRREARRLIDPDQDLRNVAIWTLTQMAVAARGTVLEVSELCLTLHENQAQSGKAR